MGEQVNIKLNGPGGGHTMALPLDAVVKGLRELGYELCRKPTDADVRKDVVLCEIDVSPLMQAIDEAIAEAVAKGLGPRPRGA